MSPAARRAWVSVLVLTGLAFAEGCAGRRHRARGEAELRTAEEAYARALEELSLGHLRRARARLEKVPLTAESRPALEPLVRLALADATFYLGDDLSLADARGKYLDFVTFYGGHPKAPYAQLQAGVCSLKQARHPSRDQSTTRVAIEDLREVGRRWPSSPYARAARGVLGLAEARLAEHEFLVGRFYYERKAYPSAVRRFRDLLDTYPGYHGKEKVYYYLGQALLRSGNAAEGRLYLDKLLTDYPNGRYAEQARKTLEAEPPARERGGA